MAVPDAQTEREIRAIEHDYHEALHRGDADWLERTLTPDAMYVHQGGGIDGDGGKAYVERLRSRTNVYVKTLVEDMLIRQYGPTVIVTGGQRVTVISRGEEKLLEHRFTRVWVRDGERWRLATNQSGALAARTP